MSVKMLWLLEEPSVVKLSTETRWGVHNKGHNSSFLTVFYHQLSHLLGAFTGKIFQIS